MIFILDNFDSFTYNLFQYFGEIGEHVTVRRSDRCSVELIQELNPELIVISPGPCTPTEASLSLEVITAFQGKIPILGVCLGHQAIGQVFGGRVVRAMRPTHGKTNDITHDGLGLFTGIPSPLRVTRYHSLVLERSTLPPDLVITAETAAGEIMGIRHRHLPIEGIQFHPEAILTAHGHTLLQNEVNLARAWLANKTFLFSRSGKDIPRQLTPINSDSTLASALIAVNKVLNPPVSSSPWLVEEFSCALPPYRLIESFRATAWPFFLDSGTNYGELGRYSFLGGGPFLAVTAYHNMVELLWPAENRRHTQPCHQDSLAQLDTLITKFRLPDRAPFPFAGGAVGFFSYDLKDELEHLPSLAGDDLGLPLWRLAWYDGVVVFDHHTGQYYLTACGMGENGRCSRVLAKQRLFDLRNLLAEFIRSCPDPDGCREHVLRSPAQTGDPLPDSGVIRPSVSKQQYLRDLGQVIEYIFAGDIYQANLTQRFHTTWSGDAWLLYRQLHMGNPAPFAAFLPYPDFQVLSSSPERFIRISHGGLIETCPIKGTRPRGHTAGEDENLARELSTSDKDRAELTMIIDLERNDLGRICRYGSVKVPDLIRMETYPTVFHLVSTITGHLQDGLQAGDILRAVFPGGSITGAPKIRAMEIIEELEPAKRGLYTGSIGYLGFDGAWDLNIVIRTIIIKEGTAYCHAGGGIVADSEPESEYEETLTKARALFKVLGGC